MQIKIFKQTDTWLKALIYGASGIGKTVFGGTAPNPIFASAEGGMLSLGDKEIPYTDIKSLEDLQELLIYLRKGGHGFETVVIDSISEINNIIKLELEKKSRDGKMQINDWGVLKNKIKGILRAFKDLPMHVIFISSEVTEKNGEVVYKVLPDLNGTTGIEIAQFMDVVIYLRSTLSGKREMITNVDPLYITKDRTNKIGNGTILDFTEMIKKYKKSDIGEEKTLYDDAIAGEENDQKQEIDESEDETPAEEEITPEPTQEESKPEEKDEDDDTRVDPKEKAKPARDKVSQTEKKADAKPIETTEVKAPVTEEKAKVQKALPVDQVKKIQILWKKYADVNKWNSEESERKKKATINRYFGVTSVNDLTEEQSKDFIARVDVAIDKLKA